jgi:hypothetical protein
MRRCCAFLPFWWNEAEHGRQYSLEKRGARRGENSGEKWSHPDPHCHSTSVPLAYHWSSHLIRDPASGSSKNPSVHSTSRPLLSRQSIQDAVHLIQDDDHTKGPPKWTPPHLSPSGQSPHWSTAGRCCPSSQLSQAAATSTTVCNRFLPWWISAQQGPQYSSSQGRHFTSAAREGASHCPHGPPSTIARSLRMAGWGGGQRGEGNGQGEVSGRGRQRACELERGHSSTPKARSKWCLEGTLRSLDDSTQSSPKKERKARDGGTQCCSTFASPEGGRTHAPPRLITGSCPQLNVEASFDGMDTLAAVHVVPQEAFGGLQGSGIGEGGRKNSLLVCGEVLGTQSLRKLSSPISSVLFP